MKVFRATLMSLLFTGLLVEGAATSLAAGLFSDANLEAAVRDGLKKGEKEELKEDDLKNLYFLRGKGKKIANLAGLEKCINLAEIVLSKNELVDLKPLSGLTNVQSLYLDDNKIVDVAPLAGLVKLQLLWIQGNQIENIEPLKTLTKMQSLDLSRNKVKSLAAVAGMDKLASLYLDQNQITDLAPLKGLKWISTLDLRRNQISDVAPLAGMTELRYTMLQGNKLTDLAPIVEMAKKDANGDRRFAPYWNLYLKENPLSDAAQKTQIAELKSLNVRVNLELGADYAKADSAKK